MSRVLDEALSEAVKASILKNQTVNTMAKAKLTPRTIARARQEQATAANVGVALYPTVGGPVAVMVVASSAQGGATALLTPGGAVRFAAGIVRRAFMAWAINLGGSVRRLRRAGVRNDLA